MSQPYGFESTQFRVFFLKLWHLCNKIIFLSKTVVLNNKITWIKTSFVHSFSARATLMVGLDLMGLFQAQLFYDSVTFESISISILF